VTTLLVVVPRGALALGVLPGVVAGALLLGGLVPASLQLGVFLALLPLILLQAARTRLTGGRVLGLLRVCMSVNAGLVAFGLAHALAATGVATGVAYQPLVATLIIDAHLLYRFFRPAAQAPLEAAA
jgi:hypothetical protein